MDIQPEASIHKLISRSNRDDKVVLIVDDKPANLDILFQYLERAGYRVIVATNGEGAIRQAQRVQPDIILMDVMMPGLDGFEACRRLKAGKATHSIPVIFISALSDTKEKVQGFEVGGADYITKPFEELEVLARLETHITLYRLQKELQQQNRLLQEENTRRRQAEEALRKSKERLRYEAQHDDLTGLPNRSHFMRRLNKAFVRSQAERTFMFAILFLDLDRFKMINDTLGHAAGDQLLIAVARRLEQCVRGGDLIARLGGDEFAILVENLNDTVGPTHLAHRIQEIMARSFQIEGQDIFTSASIGITLNNRRYENPSEILRDADAAMYRAKGQGKARSEVFDTGQFAPVSARWQLEMELPQALQRDQLRLLYQPTISLRLPRQGQLVGLEALVRWQHPGRGLLEAGEFIPLAAEIGLVAEIDEWMLQTAIRQTAAWHREGLRLAVNLSLASLTRPELPDRIQALLAEHNLPGPALEIELITSHKLKTDSQIQNSLNILKKMGVRLALDDFGIGSSMSHLKQFPLDTLKIDQQFVRGIRGEDDKDAAIVSAIIAVAHKLNLRCIAEGVETEQQLRFLCHHRCDEAQGYLFSSPILPADLAHLSPHRRFDLC